MDEIDAAQEMDGFLRELSLKKRNLHKEQEKQLIVDGRRLCLKCEEPIPDARLKANPDAVRCVECQAKHERG
jgi:DnaK suppressor protein